jgi:hypothetical protein
MHLKHIRRQVGSDRDNPRHDRRSLKNVADPPWHTNAVGGGGRIINAGLDKPDEGVQRPNGPVSAKRLRHVPLERGYPPDANRAGKGQSSR